MTRKQISRLAGALYLAMSVPSGFAIMFVPSIFVVSGDARATAARIAASPVLFRLGIFADLVGSVFAVWLAMVLYELFKDVDRLYARLMVGFMFCMVAAGLIDTVLLCAPMVLTSKASYLAAFDQHQLDAASLGVMALRSQGIRVATMFWGLWLVPLGVLVYKSGFLPRLLGVLVLCAACSYVVDCLAYFFFPDQAYEVALFSIVPQFAGEMGFTFWMLVKGARTASVET